MLERLTKIRPMPVLACGPGDFWVSVGWHSAANRPCVLWVDDCNSIWKWYGAPAPVRLSAR